jgi:hypothetical protein
VKTLDAPTRYTEKQYLATTHHNFPKHSFGVIENKHFIFTKTPNVPTPLYLSNSTSVANVPTPPCVNHHVEVITRIFSKGLAHSLDPNACAMS